MQVSYEERMQILRNNSKIFYNNFCECVEHIYENVGDFENIREKMSVMMINVIQKIRENSFNFTVEWNFYEMKNERLFDLIASKSFTDVFFSYFSEDWDKNIKNCDCIVFIYMCISLLNKNKDPLLLPEIYTQKFDMFFQSSIRYFTERNSITCFYDWLNFDKIFPSHYYEILWFAKHPMIKNKLNYNLSDDDIIKMSKKYGMKFILDHFHRVITFISKKTSKEISENQQVLTNILKENSLLIDETSISECDFRKLINMGIILEDFYVSKTKNNKNYCQLYIHRIFDRIVSESTGLDVNTDFLTQFLDKIERNQSNFFTFLSNFPENGYPMEWIINVIRRYFLEFIKNDNSFMEKTFTSINSKELFFKLINVLSNQKKVILLKKSNQFLRKFNLTINELVDQVELINSKDILPYNIFDQNISPFFNLFNDFDQIGIFVLAKYCGKDIDFIIDMIDKVDTTKQHFDKNKIILITKNLHRIKLLQCHMEHRKFEINISGMNAKLDDIRPEIYILYSSLHNKVTGEYSFIKLNKSFLFKYIYLNQLRTISFAGIPCYSDEPLDETIEFQNSWEKTYIELYNRMLLIRKPEIEETDFLELMSFFREHYESKKSDYENLNFNFMHFYQYLLRKLDSKENLLKIYIEHTTQFVNPKFLDILKDTKYITIMKSFNAEEKAEQEIDSIIKSLKRKRENDETYQACQEALKDETINPIMKKICQKFVSGFDEFLVYEHIAKNPNSIMCCAICYTYYKNSAFINFNCGHSCCAGCTNSLTNCPHCRVEITSKMPVQQTDPIDGVLLSKLRE